MSVQMPRWFVLAFNKVVDHYGCTAEERQVMTRLARESPEEARRCFKALADEIDGVDPSLHERDGVLGHEFHFHAETQYRKEMERK